MRQILLFPALLASSLLLVACIEVNTEELNANNDGSESATDRVTSIQISNSVPIARIGEDRDALLGAEVIVDGSLSSDADDDLLTFSWTLSSLPAGSASVLSYMSDDKVSFIPDLIGDYSIALLVNDGNSDSAMAMITVHITQPGVAPEGVPPDPAPIDPTPVVTLPDPAPIDPAPVVTLPDPAPVVTPPDPTPVVTPDPAPVVVVPSNSAPVAVAGADQFVSSNSTVLLDASASYDANNDELGFWWKIYGPDGKLFGETLRGKTPSFVPTAAGEYIAEVTVVDFGTLYPRELASQDEVRIVVGSKTVDLSWAAASGKTAGYIVYAGPAGGEPNARVRTLAQGGAEWNPAAPGARIGWEEALVKAGMPLDSTQVCFNVRAYNGFGLSGASDMGCVSK